MGERQRRALRECLYDIIELVCQGAHLVQVLRGERGFTFFFINLCLLLVKLGLQFVFKCLAGDNLFVEGFYFCAKLFYLRLLQQVSLLNCVRSHRVNNRFDGLVTFC